MLPRKFPKILFLLLLVSSIIALDAIRQGNFTKEKGVITLHFLYTSEKKGWINTISPEFEQWFEERNPGKRVQLIFEVTGTRSSMISIIAGESKPVMWSPAASVWTTLLEWAWEKKYDYTIFNSSSTLSLVNSPIVIGTWESFAQKHNFSSWSDLYDLVDEGMRLAHTSPQESNSGFMAVLLEVAAASGKTPSEITIEDLKNPEVQRWLEKVESTAVLYGTSTGFLAKQATQLGPSGLNVMIVYESLIIEAAKDGEAEAKWNDNIIAIYPEEGTLWSDHPFVVFDQAPWVEEAQIDAAYQFRDFLMSKEIQLSAIPYGFRPGNQTLINDNDVLASLTEVFDPALGVKLNMTIPKFENPTDGEVLDRIPDLWLKTRANKIESGNEDYYQLGDFSSFVWGNFCLAIIILLYFKKQRGRNK